MLRSKSGQASVEYLVIAVGVIVALVAFETASGLACVNGIGGKLVADKCSSLPSVFNSVLQRSVEDVTYLINLPF